MAFPSTFLFLKLSNTEKSYSCLVNNQDANIAFLSYFYVVYFILEKCLHFFMTVTFSRIQIHLLSHNV